MMQIKFNEIIRENGLLEQALSSENEYPIAVLSNLIVNQTKPILEYTLRSKKVYAKCDTGNYDNILQDSAEFSRHKMVIVLWEAANLIEGFQYKSNLMSGREMQEVIDRFTSEIDFVLNNLKDTSLVIFNTFSSLVFNHYNIRKNNFDRVCQALNDHLYSIQSANLIIIDTEKIIAKNGIDKSVDFRNYYSSKSLYTVDFFKSYCEHIAPIVLSVEGKAKKALIFDCDNTLWYGIVGEDGLNGIQMSASDKKGVVFEEVQSLAKNLAANGIIVGLNSKNNPEDVDEVLDKHENMRLTGEDIVIKKVNWNNKVDNLKAIANELNIGIDSLVFVDDSDFEINLINDMLPQVTTIQVPKLHYEYPEMIRQKLSLFYNKSVSKEDMSRLKMYREDQTRNTVKQDFSSINEYLESLGLELGIYVNNDKLIPRMAQLTQKTNQFNVTTRRYTEKDVEMFVKESKYLSFAFDVKDKFGDFGITGVAFAEIMGEEATIDSLLMSCRILGRKIDIQKPSQL
jgi:FkbH-like protein